MSHSEALHASICDMYNYYVYIFIIKIIIKIINILHLASDSLLLGLHWLIYFVVMLKYMFLLFDASK